MIRQIGKYRILERIGRGGMGSVFRAHDPVLDRPVALKVISVETDVTDELRARFFREGQACARLSHPNIVTIYDLGEADGHLFIVMELLEGEELRQLMAHRKPVDLEDKLSLMIQICDGLAYAHRKGIVHRDVKPGNIFVLKNGQVKILDFGVAHIEAAATGLTRTGLIMGTFRYMAPEQGRGRADHRADIFSVGAVFYELLTGRLPFPGENAMEILEQLRTQDPPPLAEVDPTLPPELSGIIGHALEKDPARRFAELGPMGSELQRVLHRLTEERERLRSEVMVQLAELADLQATLAKHCGDRGNEETVLEADERARLATLKTVQRDVTLRLERMRHLRTLAESLQPDVDHGVDALARGDLDEALTSLERVVRAMPEHAHAAARLEEARRQRQQERPHHTLIAELMREATAAFKVGAHARCIALLQRVEETVAPEDVPTELDQLRRDAEHAIAVEADTAPPEATRATTDTMLEHTNGRGPVAESLFPAPAATVVAVVDTERPQRVTSPATSATELVEEAIGAAPTVLRDVLVETPSVPIVMAPTTGSDISPTTRTPAAAVTLHPSMPVTRWALRWVRERVGRPRPTLALWSALGVGLVLILTMVVAHRASDLRTSSRLRDEMQQARSAMLASRDRALHVEAEQLAPDAMVTARAKAEEGNRLVEARNDAAAARAYRAATEAYAAAARAAAMKVQVRAEADAARGRMQAQKQRAQPNSTEYAVALSREKQGVALYERREFDKSSAAFDSARDAFARAVSAPAAGSPSPPAVSSSPPAVSPSPPRDDTEMIKAVLTDYARAMETKDLALVQRLRPGLSDAELSRLRSSFEITRSRKISLRLYKISVVGEEARVEGLREDTSVLNNGQSLSRETKFVYTLKRGPRGWTIHDLQDSAGRVEAHPL